MNSGLSASVVLDSTNRRHEHLKYMTELVQPMGHCHTHRSCRHHKHQKNGQSPHLEKNYLSTATAMHSIDSWIYGRFATLTFRPLDVLPPIVDVSPPGRFAPWTIRPLDDSPPGRFAHTRWTIRPQTVVLIGN